MNYCWLTFLINFLYLRVEFLVPDVGVAYCRVLDVNMVFGAQRSSKDLIKLILELHEACCGVGVPAPLEILEVFQYVLVPLDDVLVIAY